MRAKRSQEQTEREWRAREKAEAEKAQKRLEEMHVAREHQKEERERRLASLAKQEREEFERIIMLQQEQDANVRAAGEAHHTRREGYKTQLRVSFLFAHGVFFFLIL